MKCQKTDLTPAELRRILTYNRKSGIFRWRISPGGGAVAGAIAGGMEVKGYWVISIKGRLYKAHVLAWLYVYGKWPTNELDHRDLVKHHNWISNIRLASQIQNNANRPRYRNNKAGFKGVHYRNGTYRAMIRHNGISMHLGCYRTPHAAHRAYCARAQEIFGEFANAGA